MRVGKRGAWGLAASGSTLARASVIFRPLLYVHYIRLHTLPVSMFSIQARSQNGRSVSNGTQMRAVSNLKRERGSQARISRTAGCK